MGAACTGLPKRLQTPFATTPGQATSRELRNAIEHAVILAKGSQIDLEALPAELRGQTSPESDGRSIPLQVGASISLERLEEAHIRQVLDRTANLAEAAQTLGIDQATLYRKRKKLGLE